MRVGGIMQHVVFSVIPAETWRAVNCLLDVLHVYEPKETIFINFFKYSEQ
jgi:hypothetical protein